jgi:hypothetical protein
MCVHLTFEGEKHGLISSFLLIFESHIEGEFLLFMILYYLLAYFFCSTYALMFLLSVSGNMIPFVNL